MSKVLSGNGSASPLATRSSTGAEPVQLEILRGQVDGCLRQVHAGDPRAASREPHQVGADAAAGFEHRLPAEAAEIDELRQVVQFVEAVVVQIVEEFQRADRLVGHFEIVNPRVPVALNRVNHQSSATSQRAAQAA